MYTLTETLLDFYNSRLNIVVSIILAASVIGALISHVHYKRIRIFTPLVILMAGTFISGFLLFYKGEGQPFPKAVIYATKLFSAGCDYDNIGDFLKFLSFVAPLLTFSVFLSLLRDISSYLWLVVHIFSDRYIFSEMNEKSVAFAESLRCNHRFATIIFSNTDVKTNEGVDDLYERTRAINAICFRKDIYSVNFALTFGRLFFFAINQKSTENIKIATNIRRIYAKKKRTKMYIFSPSVEAEIFASSTKDECIEIRRINEPRSVIYNKLYDMEQQRINNGVPDLFSSAHTSSDGKKTISAVLIGLGAYGKEMLKALTWFCQMDGYTLKINAFDKGNTAKKHLKTSCPELFDEKHNHVHVFGEAQYEITIHSDTDVKTDEFATQIIDITDATYVFVALDSDEENISVATNLRMLFERNGKHPIIHTVVLNSDKAKLLCKCENFARQKYEIECVGDLKTAYSENVLLNSVLEKQALNIHKQWGVLDTFYSYEYNYNSSMASALHLNALIACQLRGKNKNENIEKLSILEHKRWNAYMRSEGYIYGQRRNDLAKEHPDLVPYDQLSEKEKELDRRITLTVLDI